MRTVTQSTFASEVVISSRRTRSQIFSDFWRLKELLWALTWRNIHVRYKQTAMGILWVLIRPLMMVGIYTAIFGWVAKLPSINGMPYSVMVLSGLVVWIFVAQTIAASAGSFHSDSAIVSKVYLPRLFIPLSHVLAGLVDFLVTLVFLCGLMLYKHVAFSSHLWALAGVLFFMIFLAFGVGLLLAALTLKYSDVQHVTPFLLQLGFYAAPIVYNSQIVPREYHWLYYLNPMAGLVDSLRWSLLGQPLEVFFVLESVAMCLLIFILGVLLFRAIEPVMIDQL